MFSVEHETLNHIVFYRFYRSECVFALKALLSVGYLQGIRSLDG